jgi:hypothetical protein
MNVKFSKGEREYPLNSFRSLIRTRDYKYFMDCCRAIFCVKRKNILGLNRRLIKTNRT